MDARIQGRTEAPKVNPSRSLYATVTFRFDHATSLPRFTLLFALQAAGTPSILGRIPISTALLLCISRLLSFTP